VRPKRASFGPSRQRAQERNTAYDRARSCDQPAGKVDRIDARLCGGEKRTESSGSSCRKPVFRFGEYAQCRLGKVVEVLDRGGNRKCRARPMTEPMSPWQGDSVELCRVVGVVEQACT